MSETCNDGGTPSDPSDDTYTIVVSASAANPGASGQFTVNGSTFDYATGGSITLPASDMSEALTFSDADDATCSATLNTSVLSTCSGTCVLTIITTNNVCNDNGTPTDNTDDFHDFTVNATSVNPGVSGQYIVNDGTTVHGPFTYGIDGTFTVPSGTSVILTFTDIDDVTCSSSQVIGLLSTCSTPCDLVIDSTPTINSSCGLSNGQIQVNASGGTPPYSYTLDGGTPIASNIFTGLAENSYVVGVIDFNGCVDTEIVTVGGTVVNVPTFTGNDSFCQGESTQITASAGFNIYQWSNGLGNNAAAIINAPGTYTVTVTDANGCESENSIQITENPLPTPSIIGTLSFCQGNPTTLTLDQTYASYNWSTGSTSQTAIVGTTSTVSVTVTDANGCSNSTSVNVVENANPVPTISGQAIICPGTTSFLDAGAGYVDYQWSGGLPNGQTQNVPAGTYTVVVTDANGCTGTDSFVVSEEAPIAMTFDTPEVLTCEVQTTTLGVNASGAIAYQWSSPDGGTILSGGDTATPTISGPATYEVLVFSALGCPSVSNVSVIENGNSLVEVFTSVTNPTCFGDNNGVITIDSVAGGVEPLMYSIDGEPFSSGTSFLGLPSGQYTITVMDAEGCDISTTLTVVDPPQVTLELFPLDTLIELGDSIQLETYVNPAIDSLVVTWTDTTGLNSSGLFPWAMPLQTTQYELTVADSNGCSVTETAIIRVKNEQNIYIPNAFSPNNDGFNDVFMIYGGIGVERVTMFRVFDRWGEMVFETSNFQPNDISRGWDGRFKGTLMNPAVFVYEAEVLWINGKKEIFKGDITLVGGQD